MFKRLSVPAWALVSLIAVCVFSILLNIASAQRIFEAVTPSIQGTYCTNDASMPSADNEYIAFMENGTYVKYRQFHILEQGNYRKEKDGIYAVTSSSGMESQVVCVGEKVYLSGEKRTLTAYVKFSDTPTLINVHLN